MSISSQTCVVQRSPRFSCQGLARAARVAAGTLAMLVSLTNYSAAQTSSPPQPSPWKLRFTSGALLPTGKQRNSLKDAQLSGVQLSWILRPSLAITGTLGWARSRDLASVDTPKLDVFTSDLGIEARPAQWFAGHAMTFRPFAGIGAGVRSYNCRKLDVDATNNLAGYGAVGGEFDMGRVGLRIEARDYASGFKPLVGAGTSDTRNDVVISAAVRFNRHGARKN